MKTAIIKISLAALLSASAAFGAFAQEFTKGVVNKVDAKAKKVTIKHERCAGEDDGLQGSQMRLLS
ncbi:hypothetical protein ACC797_19625 [Rhizobium ruizarguesonis]